MGFSKDNNKSDGSFIHLGSNKWGKVNRKIENQSIQSLAMQTSIIFVAITIIILLLVFI